MEFLNYNTWSIMNMNNDFTSDKNIRHPFHMIKSSCLPIILSTLIGLLAIIFILKISGTEECVIMNSLPCDIFIFISPWFIIENIWYLEYNIKIVLLLSCLLTAIASWSYKLIQESTEEGVHTIKVQKALRYGVLLFLLSEAMLFFPFFWSFFHFSLSPVDVIGATWPPVGVKGLEALDPLLLPVLNTVTLLFSGIAVVGAHRAIISGHRVMLLNSMAVAISYGIFFSLLQLIEYCLTQYSINDGTYGSVFFMLTGLHGFHVIVGTILLVISYVRIAEKTFSTDHHFGFEAAAWYWHFADVVWLGVYALVYIWNM